MPTVLQVHGQSVPEDVMGKSLLPLLHEDTPIRDTAIFGHFGAACNVTDGQPLCRGCSGKAALLRAGVMQDEAAR